MLDYFDIFAIIYRGLDIPTVDLVINESVPFVPKEYIHRVGRTARAGRGGTAITIVTQYDVPLMHKIENKISKYLIYFIILFFLI